MKVRFLQHSLDFLIYLLSFLSNIIIIWMVPSAEVKEFASTYILGNALFSLLIYYQFTNIVNERKIWLFFYIFLAFFVALICVAYDTIFLYFFYPYFYLLADHLASQKLSNQRVRLYRVVTLFTIIPFAIPETNFELNLFIRVAFFTIAAFYFHFVNVKISPLVITSRWLFVFFCYLSYTLPLYIISHIADNPSQLKIWYISTQVGIALLLKYYEFSARGAGKSLYTFASCIGFSLLLPLVVLNVSYSISIAAVYWTGCGIVIYASKFVKNEQI